MAAKQKFSDAELLRSIEQQTYSRFVGPSIRWCAKEFKVAYQSMGERVHRLIGKSLVLLDEDGVRLTQEGEEYVSALRRLGGE